MTAADAAKIAKKIIVFIKSRLFLKCVLATDSKPTLLIRVNLNLISSLRLILFQSYHPILIDFTENLEQQKGAVC